MQIASMIAFRGLPKSRVAIDNAGKSTCGPSLSRAPATASARLSAAMRTRVARQGGRPGRGLGTLHSESERSSIGFAGRSHLTL